MAKPALVLNGKISDRAVRHQLDKILASPTFQQVDRLKRFLTFVVQESVAKRSDQLKEYVIGVQVFGKEDSFDPRTDPIVRVQARRLRARLVRYYRDEGQNDELVIELPKGGYSPLVKPREGGAGPKRSLGLSLVSQNTVAVLLFGDHSAEHNLEYFCRGLRQEITHRLARSSTLRVMAVELTDLTSDSPVESLRKINAALLITGSVRKSGPTIRVTTQVVDGATGCYLWSEAVDTGAEDLIAAQETTARAIVDRLQPDRLGAGQSPLPRRPAENLAAHNLYLQGRYHLNQRTEESLRKAVDFFEKAIVEDAQYALAHSGLSDAYGLLGHYGVLGPADVWTKAASSAASAVMLDGNSAEAHTSLAHVKSTQDWDWAGAESEFQRAISLNQRYPTARHWFAASCLAPMGRLDEALEQILVGQSLDPVSTIVARDVAMMHYYRRDFEVALEQCDHTIELNPHFSPAYWALGLIQEQRKDFDEAAAAFQRALQLSPQSPRMHGALARTYALSGKKDLATGILRKLEGLTKTRYVSPFEFASIHFALEQTDRGFRWLNKACQDRCFELISLKVDPRFDSLKEDRRFAAVARQVGFK
jgi:serine/threonine-protein kinase